MALPQFEPDNRERPSLTSRTPIKGFRGLNTVADSMTLDKSWLTRADNCLITDRRKMVRAKGMIRRTTNSALSGVYATNDLRRLYAVDDGDLLEIKDDFSSVTLATGMNSAPVRFAEINGVVHYSNGVDLGIIEAGGVARPWGIAPPRGVGSVVRASGILAAGQYQGCCTLVDDRGQESGNGPVFAITVVDGSAIAIADIPQVAGYTTNLYVTTANGTVFYLLCAGAPEGFVYNASPAALGGELLFLWANQPHGILPAFYGSRAYLAEVFPQQDQSVLWRSFPLHYHLFDDGAEGFAVPGTVRMQFGTPDALIVGTDRAVYIIEDERITLVAPYGVVPGAHPSLFEGKAYFWTLRGLCRAPPFENLTADTISVAPGVSAAGTMIEQDGYRRYMVALQAGGEAFNAYSVAQLPSGGQDLGPRTRRHDWEDPYDYLATAPIGSPENAKVWKITRLTINSEGDVTAVGTANPARWTDRATEIYS